MKRIGITGCMGSGKSTVARLFEQLGIPVYNADDRAKQLMLESPALIQGIKNVFGTDAYLADGTLNRAHISAQAFSNKQLLEDLNALVHPAVFNDFENWCNKQMSHYIIKEAALMFESDSYKQLHEVIVVTAPEELRIQRAMQRDNLSREAVLARSNKQMSQEEKLSRGQYEIQNDETHLLIPQVLALHKKLTAET